MTERIITDQTAVPGAPRVHRIVQLDYVVRLVTYPMFLLVYGVQLYALNANNWTWALFVWHQVGWPHLARLIASKSRDSKAAEFRNLLIDSFFIGTAVPLTHFALFPNAVGFLGIHAGNVLNGGVRFAAKGLVLYLLGAGAMTLLAGFIFTPKDSSLTVQMLSVGMALVFSSIFSYHSFSQSQSVLRRGRRISEQAAQIEEGSALLAARGKELEVALVAAQAANDAKSNFLANMSHELRTPLNSIIGFGNILLRNREENLRPQDVTYLKRITANGAHLLTLINGVLDLSKIDAKQMQLDLTTVDVSALLRETLAEMEPQAEVREVELVADIPDLALLHTDRSRLRQIVLNLLGNAVKFTQKGRVTLHAVADPGTRILSRIDVMDTGIGIAPEKLDTIFHAFQQEDTTTARQYGGTGLGLTITRSLAHLMGWEISVESEVGAGSTFSVVMMQEDVAEIAPRASAGMRAPVAEAALAAGADGARPFLVLVIDDEVDARTIIKDQLEELGCEVMTASSADEGLSLAHHVRPDLITLDIMMPNKDGWDALKEMKRSEDLRDVPVVVISMVGREKRGQLLGAEDFIEKPVTRDSLVELVKRSVSKSTKARVLVVSDSAEDSRLYEALARSPDMSVTVLHDVQSAVAETSAERGPHLIVLDVNPWREDVATWVRTLRENPLTARVRIVVLMTDSMLDNFEKPLEFGATVVRRDLDLDLRLIVQNLKGTDISGRS